MYSVVIPVYQAREGLVRCVQSWLTQTERDLEVILVDDGSTDGSGALCDTLAKEDPRVHVVHQRNTGVSAARNAGIQAAQGSFVLFTDSDDYVAEDYLEQMAKFQTEMNSDLVLCGYHHLYEGADLIKLPKETRSYQMETFEEEFLSLYERSFLNMPWNKLYRKELLGEFDTSLSLGEDLLFNLDYLRRCQKVAILSRPLCYYIQEEKKVTLSSQKRGDRLKLAKRICKETEDFYVSQWRNTSSISEAKSRIFTRYMNEVMDECERLPRDSSLSYREKRQIIRQYAKDPWVETRGDTAVFSYLDYRILWFFLKRKQIFIVYVLCVLRSVIAEILHWVRRRR